MRESESTPLGYYHCFNVDILYLPVIIPPNCTPDIHPPNCTPDIHWYTANINTGNSRGFSMGCLCNTDSKSCNQINQKVPKQTFT